jgi:glutamate racemase
VAGSGRHSADVALIAALAAGQTTRAAAETAGVSERTATRRLADATFRAAVVEARTELLRQAVGVLAAKATAAAEGLEQLLTADSEQVRLGACRSLLEFALKGTDMFALEERLRVVEERIAAQPGQGVRRVG